MSVEQIKDFLVFAIMWFMYWLVFFHTSGLKLKKRYILPIGAGLLLLDYFYQLATYPFTFLIFFLIYYYHHPRDKVYKYIFYSLFPIVTVDLFSRAIALYLLAPLLDITPAMLNQDVILLYISYGGVFPIYYFLNKILNLNFRQIQNGTTKRKVFLAKLFAGILLSYYLIFTASVMSGLLFPHIFNLWAYRQQLVFVFMLLYLYLLSEVNHEAKLEMDKKLEESQNDKIKALEDYNHQIELLYDNIQSFKNDYETTFEHLEQIIHQGDVEAIKATYGRMIEGRQVKLNQSQYELGRLANMKVSAIKSILSTKMIEAQSQDVEAFLEIPDVIDDIYLEVLDLVIILSVFLDNAIEAAKESRRPHISVAFFKREESQLLIVDNSIRKNSVSMSKIFQEGYSTKGPNRGIGLSNVRQILENYPQTVLSTKTGHHSFTQILEMRPES